MRRFIICCLAAAVFVFPLRADEVREIEYGNRDDLRGVDRIYIFTGMELEVQQNIANHIKDKFGDRIKIANSMREAEVILAFGAQVFSSLVTVVNQQHYTADTTGTITYHQYGNYGSGYLDATTTASGYRTTTPIYSTTITGNGLILQVKNNGRTIRLIEEFADSKTLWMFGMLERRPSTNFARAFEHEWEKANEGFDFSTKVYKPVPPIPYIPPTTGEPAFAPTNMGSDVVPKADRSEQPPVVNSLMAEPTGSFLDIKSFPSGASIFVNENFVGMTPTKLRLPEGKYHIRLFSYGYGEWVQDIQIYRGSEINLNIELKRR